MSSSSSPPPDPSLSDPSGSPQPQFEPLTPEHVQFILESRGHHVPGWISMSYSNASKLHCSTITRNLNHFQTNVLRSRPLTEEEIGALTDHWNSSTNITLVAKPFSWALALLLTWRGRKTFRFPFWQPKWVKTSPDAFPTVARPIFTGRTARFTWGVSRFSAYFLLCNWLAMPFFVSYARLQATVGISSDPRLQDIMRESFRDAADQRRIHHMQKRTGRLPTQFPPQEQQDRPQGEDGAEASRDGWTPQESQPSSSGWDFPQREPSNKPEPAQPYGIGISRPQQPSPPPQAPEPSAWEADPFLEELEADDASPIAPSARAQDAQRRRAQREPRRQSPPPDDGVSAWERLREKAQAERNDDEANRRR